MSANCPGCGFANGLHWQYCEVAHREARNERAQEILARFYQEAGQDPRLVDLAQLLSGASGIVGVMAALPRILPRLETDESKVELLDALGHAYARARGFHFTEE